MHETVVINECGTCGRQSRKKIFLMLKGFAAKRMSRQPSKMEKNDYRNEMRLRGGKAKRMAGWKDEKNRN